MSDGKTIVARTIPDAAKSLRNMAELTAKNSQNWDNYQKIVEDMTRQIYEVGVEHGKEWSKHGITKDSNTGL